MKKTTLKKEYTHLEICQRGGNAVKKKYGRAHFVKMNKARWAKKKKKEVL